MSKKKHMFRQKIGKILIPAFVLVACIGPVGLTVIFVVGTLSNHDPRRTTKIAAFQPRAIDNTSQPLMPLQQPVVSVTFDDGWESVYTKALPTLRQYGLHTTQYIITDDFDNINYLSVGQIKAMQTAGEQIGSHTVTHADLTTLGSDEIKHELVDSQKTLQHELGGNITDFTSPLGAYNAYTLETIGKYYRSQKNAEGDPSANPLEAINVAGSFNPLNFKSYSVRQTTTLADLRKLLDNARDHNGWLVLTYHQVDDSDGEFSVTPEVFKMQIKLISEYKMRSSTVGQVMDNLNVGKK